MPLAAEPQYNYIATNESNIFNWLKGTKKKKKKTVTACLLGIDLDRYSNCP